MIHWTHKEDGEGRFKSSFFRDDGNNNDLIVYADSGSSDFVECAEKCVEAFNDLSETAINEICEKLIACVSEGGINVEFELPTPTLNKVRDILNYCWFVALYVDMARRDDEIAYAVEGEGEWGENIGFVIHKDRVKYVGTDYLDHMENAK